MSHIEVRAVQVAAHYQTISAFMLGLHVNEQQLNSRTANWQDIEVAYMRHIITMQDECEGVCLVAYVDNTPAGFLFAYVEEEDDSRFEEYTGRILYVSDGFIDPAYRRLGLYKLLNTHMEAHCKANDIKRITRLTMINNNGMRVLLEKEGYGATRVLYEKWL